MSRYGDNIRRIAKTDELKKDIVRSETRISSLEKATIPGQRGIAYPNSFVVGTPGQTNPDNSGATDDLSIFDNNPLGAGIDDTTTDGDDLLTGEKKPEKGEDIGAIELEDCDTGERIDVRFNTAGNEGENVFKHPNGRTPDGKSAEIPDNINDWVSGTRWIYDSGGIGPSGGVSTGPWATAGLALRAALDQLDSHVDSTSTSYYGLYNAATCAADGHGSTTSRWSIRVTDISVTESALVITSQYNESNVCTTPTVATQTITFITEDCTAGVDGACPTTAPAPPSFPDDERSFNTVWDELTPHQLAFSAEDGGFVSSKYDSTIPLQYKNPAGSGRGLSKLQLCTPDGNPVVVEALRDGTFAYFEDDGFGAPDETTNKILHFDKDGKFISTMREDEWDYLSIA